MEKIILKVHSFSDVITNSSEVIYVTVDEKTIDSLKELINYFLKNAGSDKKADDLFTFSTELDEAYVERILDNIDKVKESLLPKDALELLRKGIKLEDQYKIVRRLVNEGKIDPDDYRSDYSFREDHIIITPKDNSKEAIDITDKFRSIFELEAMYDG